MDLSGAEAVGFSGAATGRRPEFESAWFLSYSFNRKPVLPDISGRQLLKLNYLYRSRKIGNVSVKSRIENGGQIPQNILGQVRLG